MRSAVVFVVLLSFGIVGAVARSGAQGAQTPPATPPAQGQPPAGAPAGPGGQRGTPPPPQNLKVLPKNWTRQQVQALMQTFVVSLGQQPIQATPGQPPPTPTPGQNEGCLHCHVAGQPAAPPAVAAPAAGAPAGAPPQGRGNFVPPDYASDANPNKDIARKMIQMVMTINDTTKEVGDKAVVEKVSCWTCHQGKSKPAMLPENGWGRGGFSLLPPGPPTGPGRGGLE